MDKYSQFENLYKQHHQVLVNFAMNMVNDSDAAKDIVQEVFVRLWNRREEIEFGPYIKSYLFKAVTNTSLNHLQSNKKRLQIFQTLISRNPIIRDGPNEMEKKEFQHKVRDAIDKLPPKCKVIFILSKHEGKKYREIAAELNISIKTVENQMGIALKRLREDLKKYMGWESLVLFFLLILIITYLI